MTRWVAMGWAAQGQGAKQIYARSEGAELGMKRENFGDEIGAYRLNFAFPEERHFPVALRVGRPYLVCEGQWACPVELDGLEPRHPDIRGGSSLQALCLSLSLMRSRMEDFIAKGGRIRDSEDGALWDAGTIDAIFGSIGTAQLAE